MDDAGGFEKVTEGVGEEKTVIFDEISLVESILIGFLFPESTGDCDMALRVGEVVSTFWGVPHWFGSECRRF